MSLHHSMRSNVPQFFPQRVLLILSVWMGSAVSLDGIHESAVE